MTTLTEFELVCLANSRKLGGYCVAGVVPAEGNAWRRPVSPTGAGTLFDSHVVLDTGRKVGLLDVVRIRATGPAPKPYQPENWTVPEHGWRYVRTVAAPEARPLLRSLAVGGPELLGSTGDSIPERHFDGSCAGASLALVRPAGLRFHVERREGGRPQARALFSLDGARYNLSVTDLAWEARLCRYGTGRVIDAASVGLGAGKEVFLTVSLGEPLQPQGRCYKLVAAIIAL